MKKLLLSTVAAVLGMTTLSPLSAQAASLVPVDFDQLTLGAKIVGPVGPDVETSFVTRSGNGVGDLSSSVSCPAGFASCLPPTNPAGTIYTYVHEVTPGVDFPNDAPFAQPSTVLPIDDTIAFRLTFPATGFNGVAGYSFSEATAALGANNALKVTETNDDRLLWRVPKLAEWNKGEKITFFWQTTQNPSGPGGIYSLHSADANGKGNGPLPSPLEQATVPEPGAIAPLVLLSVGLLWKRRVSES